MTQPILTVKSLVKRFPMRQGALSFRKKSLVALDHVSLEIRRGETLGLVGESGCGKSTLGRTAIRLIAADEGEVIFDNRNIFDFSRREMRGFRRKVQIIFQDPFGALNPRMSVFQILMEPLIVHDLGNTKEDRIGRIRRILDAVGLAESHLNRYPHEFSGGQRQRICIARALILEPELLICDEPVSALDVSIQAQMVNLLKKIKNEFKVSMLFISHDLRIVQSLSDRIAVMYLGKIVELGPAKDLFLNPKHPYTRALLDSLPSLDPDSRHKKWVQLGEPPSAIEPPSGCTFHPRCRKSDGNLCKSQSPELLGDTWMRACHFPND